MNKLGAIAGTALIAALGLAQEGPKDASPIVTKVIRVHYVNAKALAELVRPDSPATIVGDSGLRAVVVRGHAADVAVTEQTIKELDVPTASELAKNVEVTVYVIGATNKSQSSGAEPKEIQPVIKQLESIFPYGSYQLLDTMLIRSREGGRSALTSGQIRNFPGAQNPGSSSYTVTYSVPSESPQGQPRLIHLDNFRFNAKGELAPNVDIDTDIDLREGQKVVVGNSNVEGGESALFVVVSAKILE